MLHRKKTLSGELSLKVANLREKTTSIEKQLDQFANFQNSGKSLTFCIENIVKFLEAEEVDMDIEIPGVTLIDPVKLVK